MSKRPIQALLAGAVFLSSCSSSAPREVSRDQLMNAVTRGRTKIDTYQYIGTSTDAVYLEHLRPTLIGEQREIWGAPRKDFSRRDLQTLEKSRR